MSLSDQLALPFESSGEATFANFIGDENRHVARMLEQFVNDSGEPFVYVSGPAGSGKTHLAIAALKQFEANGVEATYLSMHSLGQLPEDSLTDALEAFSGYESVVLDDLERDSLLPFQERFLFNLYNYLLASGSRILVFSNCAVSQLGLSLPDLVSRFGAGLSLRLRSLTDIEKEQLFRDSARERGLKVGSDLSSYIMRRSGRDLNELMKVLDLLDQASWVEKQKLSIPFVKKIMAW